MHIHGHVRTNAYSYTCTYVVGIYDCVPVSPVVPGPFRACLCLHMPPGASGCISVSPDAPRAPLAVPPSVPGRPWPYPSVFQSLNMHSYKHRRICAHMQMCICTHTCVYVVMCRCTHAQAYRVEKTYIQTHVQYVYTYIHGHVRTNAYSYTFTYVAGRYGCVPVSPGVPGPFRACISVSTCPRAPLDVSRCLQMSPSAPGGAAQRPRAPLDVTQFLPVLEHAFIHA